MNWMTQPCVRLSAAEACWRQRSTSSWVGIMTAALTIFIAYHGWTALNSAQQLVADLQTKRAEAGQAIAEANALNGKAGYETMARATLEAELKKTQEQAAAARADADAQNAVINGASMRLATIRAELEKTQAEAAQAKADADAQNQTIDGLPAAVAQKKAEVETAEEKVNREIAKHRYVVQQMLCSLSGDFWSSGGCKQ